MKASDLVAALEAESDLQKSENERLRAQVHRQEGAIKEARAQNQDLIRKLAKATELAATLTSYFHGAHGTAEHLERKRKELEAMDGGPVIEAPSAKRPSLIERLYQTKEKPHAHAQVDHPRKDTSSVRAENGNAG